MTREQAVIEANRRNATGEWNGRFVPVKNGDHWVVLYRDVFGLG